MSRVTHFEIQASKPLELMAFYTELLGWKFNKWGAANYWLIETGPPEEPGINGGLLPRPVEKRGQAPWVNAFVCPVQVSSLDMTMSNATALGAELALAKMAVPGVGWLA